MKPIYSFFGSFQNLILFGSSFTLFDSSPAAIILISRTFFGSPNSSFHSFIVFSFFEYLSRCTHTVDTVSSSTSRSALRFSHETLSSVTWCFTSLHGISPKGEITISSKFLRDLHSSLLSLSPDRSFDPPQLPLRFHSWNQSRSFSRH
jgi:hypothetical protein